MYEGKIIIIDNRGVNSTVYEDNVVFNNNLPTKGKRHFIHEAQQPPVIKVEGG